MSKILIFMMFQICCTSAFAAGQCASTIKGINLAGPEFGAKVTDYYRFPTKENAAYYNSVGFDTIRLPLKWERLQPVLFQNLDSAYLKQIIDVLDIAQLNKQKVLLDLHNYGRYNDKVVGSVPEVPIKSFYDVWNKIASAVGAHPAVFAYGLMNEPHGMGDSRLWPAIAQAGVDGVRSVDMTHTLFVAGDGWSNVLNWSKNNPAPFVKDPSNKVVYEAHIYFDDNSSGTYKVGVADPSVNLPKLVIDRLTPFIDWLSKYSQNGVIGEWGVPKDGSWTPVIDTFLSTTDANCLGWFFWGGGLSQGNILSLEPMNGVDKPQIARVKQRYMQP